MNLRQIPLPDLSAGENPYRPFVRMLFGSFNPDAAKVSYGGKKGLTKFERNASAEKYAGVPRLLADSDIDPEAAEQFILDFPGQMNGIITTDRKSYFKRSVVSDGEIVERLGRITPIGEVVFPTGLVLTTETFGTAWFVRQGNKLVIYGTLPRTADKARAAALASADASQSEHGADEEVAKDVALLKELGSKAPKLKLLPLAA